MTDAGLKCEAVTIFDVPQRSQIKQKRSQNKCSSPLCTKHWKIITFDHHKFPVLIVPPKFVVAILSKSVFLKEKLQSDTPTAVVELKSFGKQTNQPK